MRRYRKLADPHLLVDQLATDSPRTWVAISPPTMHIVVRTALPPATLAPAIARTVRDIDPSIPVAHLREMDEVFAESIQRPRLLAQLLATFSALALLLAAIGTYGVLAYMVAERRHEIGIRMALGAGKQTILRMVIGQGLRLALLGLTIGVVAAIIVTRALASFSNLLYGVKSNDPLTFLVVSLLMTGIALLACYVPARRAMRVDPMVALRYE